MNNIPMLAQALQKQIVKFIETECGGEDVNEEEEKMYQELKIAAGCISDYLDTQQLHDRKFEVGKAYYDKYYDLRIVEKITTQGVKFKGAYGVSRKDKDLNGNERVHGVYTVHA